jgi:hypothetical protein
LIESTVFSFMRHTWNMTTDSNRIKYICVLFSFFRISRCPLPYLWRHSSMTSKYMSCHISCMSHEGKYGTFNQILVRKAQMKFYVFLRVECSETNEKKQKFLSRVEDHPGFPNNACKYLFLPFFNDVKICVTSYFMYGVSHEVKYCTFNKILVRKAQISVESYLVY